MWHGLLVVNKESGYTSHQVIAILRRILGQSSIGHTGTLDPMATGVLVVGLGEATRVFPYLNECDKIYRANVMLGQTTDTQDRTGSLLSENFDTQVYLPTLTEKITSLTGVIEQLPPMYSAVKLKGKKLYELARAGLVVERVKRRITVSEWRIINPKEYYGYKDQFECIIKCSRGTYVRTLVADLGQELGCGAVLADLCRLQSGDFRLQDALLLDEVRDYHARGELGRFIIPIHQALPDLICISVETEDQEKVRHGGKLSYSKYNLSVPPGTLAQVMNENQQTMALVRLETGSANLYWQPVRVFNNS